MIAIVGAGASGLATAIFAARRGASSPIVLLDGASHIGAKILVSGGGRCNVTNAHVSERDFEGGSRPFVRKVIAALPVPATRELFAELGVTLREEEDGKLFPESNQARSVLRALLDETRRLGVELRPGTRVHDVRRELRGGFVLETSGGALSAQRVVLATGGLSLPKSGSDGAGHRMAEGLGHSIVAPVPALVPLVLSGNFHRSLSGVALPVELRWRVGPTREGRIRGSLLFTHFGISGPAALDVSRHFGLAKRDGLAFRLEASLLPSSKTEELDRELALAGQSSPHLSVARALAARLPLALARALLAELGIEEGVRLGRLRAAERRKLVAALLAWPLPVVDSRGYSAAEVTAGGVSLAELNPATLESRPCPGLHIVGELLDVDGRLGGFNFQWAWSSGFVAGRALAHREQRAPDRPAEHPAEIVVGSRTDPTR